MSRLLVLHGAIRNVGDFLIRRRALRLVGSVIDVDIEDRFRGEIIGGKDMDQFSGAILAGGPAIAVDTVPRVHPNLTGLNEHGVPTWMLAVGWAGGENWADARLDAPTARALETMAAATGAISVRDDITKGVIERSASVPVQMTGCVAWYDLPSIGQPLEAPDRVERVVVTAPASGRLQRQALRVARHVKRRFPSAEVVLSYHRGLSPAMGNGLKRSATYAAGAMAARVSGIGILDAAGDTDRIESYKRADLHIGYRVHAHLDFLSRRSPSLLLAEDARGKGQNLALGDPYAIDAWADDEAKILDSIDAWIDSGFASAGDAVAVIDATWPRMRDFLDGINERLT